LKAEEHTRALKMVGTREHFNERAHVGNTAVYNIYLSYYISTICLLVKLTIKLEKLIGCGHFEYSSKLILLQIKAIGFVEPIVSDQALLTKILIVSFKGTLVKRAVTS